jgi:hypothetical protein
MITVINNFLEYKYCDYMIDYYNSNLETVTEVRKSVYNFDGLDVSKEYENFEFLHPLFKRKTLEKENTLRIQLIDKTINQVSTPHSHVNPYSFIIFLNDDFIGGELIFGNLTITPKRGQCIYFNGEKHSVEYEFKKNLI